MKHKLNIIIGSTRPGRAGPVFAHWLEDFAREHGKFEPVLTDIATFHLPVLDEPHHPRLGNYQNDHTKAWSKVIDAADAFVFVAPAIVNAIDYLAREWKYKPAAIFSYGGISGGLRAAQALKPLLTAVGVMPISEGVALPMYQKLLESDGSFQASEQVEGGTKTMLDELSRWSGALKPMRAT
ncbi:NADPH-dependent FMN reductase [Mesorhizobium sp. LSJC285A00]|uniref:NADPH-dependent FMN reductase n=1 Tax=Mesorhizobium sp. LSJC285A00 TaxID=1287338 RepID=UPI0003CF7CCF|nr:NADPH-dependent FMN reductase [Mesorhizobium sp. LSJC285A00]ESW78623.1 NADPH-dependent FMN reductase [Mesorhizobium sp. LSJC285A00]